MLEIWWLHPQSSHTLAHKTPYKQKTIKYRETERSLLSTNKLMGIQVISSAMKDVIHRCRFISSVPGFIEVE